MHACLALYVFTELAYALVFGEYELLSDHNLWLANYNNCAGQKIYICLSRTIIVPKFRTLLHAVNMSDGGKSPAINLRRLTNNQKVMRVEWFTDALRARYFYFTSQSNIVLRPNCHSQLQATAEFQG